MRGYLGIEKRSALTEMVLGPEGVRGMAISLSAGVFAGFVAAHLRLHLGLPGHKALLWMMPVIAARLLGRCRVGATSGMLTASFVSLGMGGNLAGGLSGLPLVGLAGALIDATIVQLERRKTGTLTTIVVVAFSAMVANLICCVKRLSVPVGVTAHDFFGGVSFLARPLSYGLFGFLAGLIAATGALLSRRYKKPSQ